MADIGRDVGLEGDVHRAGDVHRTLAGQADVLGDPGAGAVGADEVLRPDVVILAGEPVTHPDRDARVVLRMREVLGGEAGLGPAQGGVLDEDRFEVCLRDVDGEAGRGQPVVRLPVWSCAPGVDAADLLARDGCAEDGVTDEAVLGGVGQYLSLDPHVAEDLHRPLVGDVRPGGVRGPPVLGDHDVGDPQGRQEQGRRGSGRAGADDQDIGVDVRRCRRFGLSLTVVELGHGVSHLLLAVF